MTKISTAHKIPSFYYLSAFMCDSIESWRFTARCSRHGPFGCWEQSVGGFVRQSREKMIQDARILEYELKILLHDARKLYREVHTAIHYILRAPFPTAEWHAGLYVLGNKGIWAAGDAVLAGRTSVRRTRNPMQTGEDPWRTAVRKLCILKARWTQSQRLKLQSTGHGHLTLLCKGRLS